MELNQIRETLLQVVNEQAELGSQFQQTPVLREAAKRLGILFTNRIEYQQALLTLWYDLFRSGYLAWGFNFDNPGPPWCHLTENGRNLLKNFSRDPANPDGYLQYLSSQASINEIAESYIREALQTYNASCFKATAVMVGCAAESIVLELRDALVSRMTALGKDLPRGLQHWMIKTVLDAIEKELEPYTKINIQPSMPKSLAESFSYYWSAFTGQIRSTRNEAGHPSSVDPVTPDTVHAALLTFPLQAKLTSELMSWINTSYV